MRGAEATGRLRPLSENKYWWLVVLILQAVLLAKIIHMRLKTGARLTAQRLTFHTLSTSTHEESKM